MPAARGGAGAAAARPPRFAVPPLAAAVPTFLAPDSTQGFSAQMRSALMPELNGITKAQLVEPSPTAVLPTPPPGYRYAIGPRRGQYAVLQPVAVSEEALAAAALPPPPEVPAAEAPVALPPAMSAAMSAVYLGASLHATAGAPQRPPPQLPPAGAAAGRGGGPGSRGGVPRPRAPAGGGRGVKKPTGNGDRPGRRLIAEAAEALQAVPGGAALLPRGAASAQDLAAAVAAAALRAGGGPNMSTAGLPMPPAPMAAPMPNMGLPAGGLGALAARVAGVAPTNGAAPRVASAPAPAPFPPPPFHPAPIPAGGAPGDLGAHPLPPNMSTAGLPNNLPEPRARVPVYNTAYAGAAQKKQEAAAAAAAAASHRAAMADRQHGMGGHAPQGPPIALPPVGQLPTAFLVPSENGYQLAAGAAPAATPAPAVAMEGVTHGAPTAYSVEMVEDAD